MRTDPLRVFAPAKINLYLHVAGKRADGYHALESLVVFADAGDELSIEAAPELSLAVEGPFAQGLAGEADNLVLRAARVLNVRARMTLVKALPVASGIGGGSADAAAALRGLAALNPGVADQARLLHLAAELGSDVPACVISRPLMMRGRGEEVEVLASFPPLAAVLVNPGVAVPTAKVFAALKNHSGSAMAPHPFDLSGPEPLIRYLGTVRNDLEPTARALAPQISSVLGELSRMPGCRLARMSGSGATCFGLFDAQMDAELAATALRHSHPGWWVRATVLGS